MTLILASVLSFADVEALFVPAQFRVHLDWDLLRSTNPAVSMEIIDVDSDPRLSTPWYVDHTLGCEVPYVETDAAPLRLSEVADHLAYLNYDRVARIADIGTTSTPGAETWTLPCYAVGDTLLALDGNHRLASSTVHSLSARLLAVVIHGPADPAILPDLAAFRDV